VAAGAAPAQTPTYSEQIAAIIYNNCTSCHREGEVAPFPLTSYAEVAKRGRTIAAVTQARYMPPWKAEPGWVAYRGEKRLTDEQISLIQRWVAGGMPQGDPAREPAKPVFPSGWQLGTPDLILEMPQAFPVPAEGSDIYRNFALPTNLPEDKWVRAVEFKPSSRPVVHHALFFSDNTGRARMQQAADGLPGFPGLGTVFTVTDPQQALTGGLGGWVPGTYPEFLPEGLAWPLAKGSDFLIQTHFHPNGAATTEKTQVGLYFGPPPTRRIMEVQAPPFFGIRAGIDIPAGAKDYKLRGSFTLPVDVDVIKVSAHAHYLGKEAKLTATLPNGDVRVLLWIREWDFRWQQQFTLANAVALPRGTRLDGEFTYDNSADNPFNPSHPPQRVRWGEQSTDEMGSLIMTVVPRTNADLGVLQTAVVASVLVTPPAVGSKPLFVSSGLVDGASAQPGTVTPGKILVLYGERLGPATLTAARLAADGRVATELAGTTVTFDNVPAPILYTSAGQVAVVAPYALEGKNGTQVRVRFGSQTSDPIALPVVPAAPSIFTTNFSGAGQGAILNQDGVTVNSAARPADKGSIVSIYATGEGQTSPAGVDGRIAAGGNLPRPARAVKVFIGGREAEVLYAGAAPGNVAGLFQVNARIPSDTPSGDAEVILQVGEARSRAGVTVAVK
jgi:uncharacterized protein (TIGR03437 family)